MIIGFAEAFNRLKEYKGKADPANYDIYKVEKGYVIVEKGVPYIDGYAGTFLPTELDKFFEGEWQAQVEDLIAAFERIGYNKTEARLFVDKGIDIDEIIVMKKKYPKEEKKKKKEDSNWHEPPYIPKGVKP